MPEANIKEYLENQQSLALEVTSLVDGCVSRYLFYIKKDPRQCVSLFGYGKRFLPGLDADLLRSSRFCLGQGQR
jgi:hypothetical protein